MLRPDLLAVLEDQRRHRDQHQGNEPQQRVAPPQPEDPVHLGPSKRQHGRHHRPADRQRRDGARRVLGERVDHVRLDGDEDAHHAEAEGHEADDRHDPVHVLVDRPAVPEEGDGDEAGEEDAGRQPELGLEDALVGQRHAHDGRVGELRDDGDAEEEANADA